MYKKVKTNELFDCSIPFLKEKFYSLEYPWEILPDIRLLINKLIADGIEGYTLLKNGVLVGKNVKIAHTAIIDECTIIGHNTEILHDVHIRGNVIIGEHCVVGNSSEYKNCILLNNVNAPHYNCIYDSVIGNNVKFSRGCACSSLKSNGQPIVIKSDPVINTGLKNVGAVVGDGAILGTAIMLEPGTVIGKNTTVFPRIKINGVYPENCIVKSQSQYVYKDKSFA